MELLTAIIVHFCFLLIFRLRAAVLLTFFNINRAAQPIRDVRVLFRSDSGDHAPINRFNCQMQLNTLMNAQVYVYTL